MDNSLARPPAYENKKTARRLFEEVWDKGQLPVANQLVAPNHVTHGPQNLPNAPRGPEGVKQLVSMYRRAIPDMQHTIEDQMVDGDKVVTRWTIHGMHKGELFGMAATGRRVILTGITIDRMSGGKIVETWMDVDLLGLMQQIGAIPALRV